MIWALWHRLWIEAAALIALFLAVGIILDFIQPSESIQVAVMIAIAVLIGASGNNWRRESLRRRGFLDAGVVVGPDRENALCRYLDLRSLTTPEQRAFSANARFGLPASASLAMAPQTADQFASMVLGESGSGDRREFAVVPRFDGRSAEERAADETARPGEAPDSESPRDGSPRPGHGG